MERYRDPCVWCAEHRPSFEATDLRLPRFTLRTIRHPPIDGHQEACEAVNIDRGRAHAGNDRFDVRPRPRPACERHQSVERRAEINEALDDAVMTLLGIDHSTV